MFVHLVVCFIMKHFVKIIIHMAGMSKLFGTGSMYAVAMRSFGEIRRLETSSIHQSKVAARVDKALAALVRAVVSHYALAEA
ncbi:hypothetical protein SD70_17315 [Gordoniibacillus kamchatkensis]|uniref:Uncharacterized protein n=1 Tax=Gordoniibacillus kamchatkensis TaxID=1590651 RepID=A0ABR5AFN3_9BACL|nr:hypothetical protein SD70_17315 [Paenibacillus sp. VKM B-2647]